MCVAIILDATLTWKSSQPMGSTFDFRRLEPCRNGFVRCLYSALSHSVDNESKEIRHLVSMVHRRYAKRC